MKNFPNGFDMWQETHFEMVKYICLVHMKEDLAEYPDAMDRERWWHIDLVILANDMADAFERQHEGCCRDGYYHGDYTEDIKNFQLGYIKNAKN